MYPTVHFTGPAIQLSRLGVSYEISSFMHDLTKAEILERYQSVILPISHDPNVIFSWLQRQQYAPPATSSSNVIIDQGTVNNEDV
eukprot:CAMPEP_0198156018 /NCGR_PEP_ID=MMETSP1443-20131203/69436_1 /TAXON_ID=186043 /ORGANISM="Entomoneis sp., Strain CCMP2396" /LENGTH=84 /DNA_ID=CAMNT_0043822793 /DNA_START=543 /DNA_END=797 /DNA_ORIENTATION=-